VTDEPLEMNHVHFLVAPRIEKSRDFSAHVVCVLGLRTAGYMYLGLLGGTYG